MATRIVFISCTSGPFFKEEYVDFEYYNGFALVQKQKSIQSLHDSYLANHKMAKVLEVSSKSDVELGTHLSAFNLMFTDDSTGNEYHLENIFQSSKVYKNGGPFRDLLDVEPKEAKRDERHKTSGDLVRFEWNAEKWNLEPKTMFYDWTYCKALSQHPDLVDELISYGYDSFTDIEFNHKKSLNCQARAAAIFVSLYRQDLLSEYLNDRDKWKTIY